MQQLARKLSLKTVHPAEDVGQPVATLASAIHVVVILYDAWARNRAERAFTPPAYRLISTSNGITGL
jgi:hypothetical protein